MKLKNNYKSIEDIHDTENQQRINIKDDHFYRVCIFSTLSKQITSSSAYSFIEWKFQTPN